MSNDKLKNGYMTEEKFILECIKRDLTVSRPIFNIEPYDFIVEKDNKLYTVQVKKAWVDKRNKNIACLKTSYPRSDKVNSIVQNERVSHIAILTEQNQWYIIPRVVISNLKTAIAVSEKGNYGKYINNFDFNI